MRCVWAFITALGIVVLAALAVSCTGTYNVAANVADVGLVKWFLSSTMQRSVSSHAQSVSAPVQLTDQPAQQGLHIYNGTCARRAGEGSRRYRQGPQSRSALPARYSRALDERAAVLDHQERDQNDGNGLLWRRA
jgi:hypothetical protein